MNIPAIAPSENLSTLIRQAQTALDNAKSAAEVLEARNMARVAYDAAKSATRIARAKRSHDTIMHEAHITSAKALAMRSRAEMLLASEYDAAQERGEIAKPGNPNFFSSEKLPSASDVGLSPKELHEARLLRDAEAAEPGLITRALDAMLERGEEPTRAALRREIEAPKPKKVMNPKALWLWGRLKDFEREGVLSQDPQNLLDEMTEPMRADVRRLLPLVRGFIEDLECKV